MPTNSELAAKIAAGRYTRGMDGDFKILRDEVKRLRAINAELLAACEAATVAVDHAIKAAQKTGDPDFLAHALIADKLRAAIMKAKG